MTTPEDIISTLEGYPEYTRGFHDKFGMMRWKLTNEIEIKNVSFEVKY